MFSSSLAVVVERKIPAATFSRRSYRQKRAQVPWIPLAYREGGAAAAARKNNRRSREDGGGASSSSPRHRGLPGRSPRAERKRNNGNGNYHRNHIPRGEHRHSRFVGRNPYQQQSSISPNSTKSQQHINTNNDKPLKQQIKENRKLIEEKEQHILNLHKELLRLIGRYRQVFSSEPVPIIKPSSSSGAEKTAVIVKYQDKRSEKQAVLRNFRLKVSQALNSDIHQADSLVDWSQIEQTEDLFRGLCRLLREMVAISTDLHKIDNRNANELLDLAEASVRHLVRLRSERSLLVESTKKWSSNAAAHNLYSKKKKAADKFPLKLLTEDAAIHTSPRSLTGWIHTLLDGFPPAMPSSSPTDNSAGDCKHNKKQAQQNASNTTTTTMAHEDPRLGATPELLASVLQRIASCSPREQFENNSNSNEERKSSPGRSTKCYNNGDSHNNNGQKQAIAEQQSLQNASRRMVVILDLLPLSEIPDANVVKTVMETLSRAGTFESAQTCYHLYQRYPELQGRLSLSLVLQAFLEASRYEDENNAKKAANTAISVLHKHWNMKNFPRHRVERIFQASIVLHCMVSAKMGSTLQGGMDAAIAPKACEEADRLIKRALGGSNFEQLRKEITSTEPRVDTQVFPLLNFLAHLYATSGDNVKFDSAKQMLAYMMSHEKQGVGRSIVYPSVDTVNTILQVLINRQERRNESDPGAKASIEDVHYGMSLLDYMLGCFEPQCWPNDKTFELLFRMLSLSMLTGKHPDGGDLAEDLLSKMELRHAFSRSSDIQTTLLTYHRALRCWWGAAKSDMGGVRACERALELVDKLEAQSSPLLLSDTELQKTEVLALYKPDLRPTARTYGLVLMACSETKVPSEKEKAAATAIIVLRRMVVRGMKLCKSSSETNDTSSVLANGLLELLPVEDSDKRSEMCDLLGSVDDEFGQGKDSRQEKDDASRKEQPQHQETVTVL